MAMHTLRYRHGRAHRLGWRRKHEMKGITDVIDFDGLAGQRSPHDALVRAHQFSAFVVPAVFEETCVPAYVGHHVRFQGRGHRAILPPQSAGEPLDALDAYSVSCDAHHKE
jgi:hypothetical protein